MKNKNLPKRFLSRLIAVQSFYQYEFYQKKKPIDILSKNLVDNYFLVESEESSSYADKIDSDLLESLLSGFMLAQDKIDDEITPFLKGEWKIEDLADLILPILRLATFELKFMKDVPTKVVISEYVDLAACFYDAKQVTFVNSILQNIANKNRV
ncbi:MAG: N utilization substance protein B [Myxococcota bacterium]|jgi:N utilization substance protein B